MKSANKMWAKRVQQIKGYDTAIKDADNIVSGVPDGRYQMRIKSAEFGDSKNGRLQIIVKGEIVNHEEQDGQPLTSFLGLEDKSLSYTAATLKRMGYEMEGDSPEELLDIVDQLGSSNAVANVQVKDGYTNIFGPAEDLGEVEESDNEETEEEEETENEESEDESEEESEEESEDSIKEIVEGSKVKWIGKDKKEKTGEVLEILETENKARVEIDGGGIARIEIDRLSLVETEETEETEEEEIPEEPESEEEEENEDGEEDNEKSSKKSRKKVTRKSPVIKKKAPAKKRVTRK